MSRRIVSWAHFLSRDLAGFRCGPNLYAYYCDNPVDCFDPTGAVPIDWGGMLGRAGSIIGGGAIGFILGGPPGLVAGAFAGNNLYNAAQGAGTAQGQYDSHKLSGWSLAGAYGNLGLAAGSLGLPALGSLGSGLQGLGEAEDAVGAAETAGETAADAAGQGSDIALSLDRNLLHTIYALFAE